MNKSGEENRSVRNTKRRLREGLLSLLEQRPINEISVKELTALVDVNRGTFYFHYQDIYDMLWKIENEFFEEFDRKLSDVPQGDFNSEAYHYLYTVFSFLGENGDFCRIMLGAHGDMQFVERVKDRVDAQCSIIWKMLAPDADQARYELYNAFIINGCVGLIRQWVENTEETTAEQITELTLTIIRASVSLCVSSH